MTRVPRSVMVIGIGNAMRGDDGAGLEVVRRLEGCSSLPARVRVEAFEGEPVDLLDRWEHADAVVLVDTVRSGSPPGTIHRIDASRDQVRAVLRRASSHTIGAGEVIELGRTLGRLPATVVVYGIEGAQFDAATELSSPVAAAVDGVIERVFGEARALACAGPG